VLVHALNRPPIRVLGRVPGTALWRDLDRYRDGETVPGVFVVRVVGPVFFATVQRIRVLSLGQSRAM
jgi:SulP family sulfate permease